MRLSIDETVFEKFPDLEVGVVAIKGIDNLTQDPDIEAFLRHAGLEAGLMLRLKPIERDPGLLACRAALETLGAPEAVTSVERTVEEFVEGLTRGAEQTFTPGATTGLEGALALPRENPVSDLTRGAELQFRLPVISFDVGRGETPVTLTEEAGDFVWKFGEEISVRHLFCETEAAGRVDEETRNLLLVLPCFAVNRRKAMSVRNELARRLKDSFGRTSESAWLSADEREYVSKI